MKHSQTYYNNRRKLKELSYDKAKFRPTVSDIEEWFVILNQQIFGNKLSPFSAIHIGRPKRVHALFQYWKTEEKQKENRLTMTQVFESKRLFVEILAHEMIHLFQFQYDEPLGHGPSFWLWSDHFKLKGINLHKVA